eukprot:4579272-Karenia_brevis.AAC.1
MQAIGAIANHGAAIRQAQATFCGQHGQGSQEISEGSQQLILDRPGEKLTVIVASNTLTAQCTIVVGALIHIIGSGSVTVRVSARPVTVGNTGTSGCR